MRTGRGTGGTALDAVWMDLLWRSFAGDVFVDTADCDAVNCRELVYLDHEGCSSRSGGPQCFGEIWDDVQCGV